MGWGNEKVQRNSNKTTGRKNINIHLIVRKHHRQVPGLGGHFSINLILRKAKRTLKYPFKNLTTTYTYENSLCSLVFLQKTMVTQNRPKRGNKMRSINTLHGFDIKI